MNLSHFPIPTGICYLNGAYMSPQALPVYEAGNRALQLKNEPWSIAPFDFFTGPEELRKHFGSLINAAPDACAIIPSVSYGLANAVANISLIGKSHVLIVSEEFPSDYYSFEVLRRQGISLIPVMPPSTLDDRGKVWNHKIIDSIKSDTAAVVLSIVHWADGTLFDIVQIGAKCKELGVVLVVDGTQSVGALPIDVQRSNIDVLVCAGYKWLLGPYSIGLAYYSPKFHHGYPIEQSWMNRHGSDDFANLTRYSPDYRPGAARFNVGESSNFLLVSMMIKALELVKELGPFKIQEHCRRLIHSQVDNWRELGFWVEDEAYRSNHLVGLRIPESVDKSALMAFLKSRNIFVSLRGDFLRVSPHVYNTLDDMEFFTAALRDFVSG